MRVRIGQYAVPWSRAEGSWFYAHRDEEFDVITVHEGSNRLYEVDVRHLAESGSIEVSRAFVPAMFAEELEDEPAYAVTWWDAAS